MKACPIKLALDRDETLHSDSISRGMSNIVSELKADQEMPNFDDASAMEGNE